MVDDSSLLQKILHAFALRNFLRQTLQQMISLHNTSSIGRLQQQQVEKLIIIRSEILHEGQQYIDQLKELENHEVVQYQTQINRTTSHGHQFTAGPFNEQSDTDEGDPFMQLLWYLLKEANILMEFINPNQQRQSSTAVTNGSPMPTFGSSTSSPMGELTIAEIIENRFIYHLFVFRFLKRLFHLPSQTAPHNYLTEFLKILALPLFPGTLQQYHNSLCIYTYPLVATGGSGGQNADSNSNNETENLPSIPRLVDLNRHYTTGDDGRFYCYHCPASQTGWSRLRELYRRHTLPFHLGVRFCCPLCSGMYMRYDTLLRHTRNNHN